MIIDDTYPLEDIFLSYSEINFVNNKRAKWEIEDKNNKENKEFEFDSKKFKNK
jgi:hypothetical protein